MTTVGAEPPRVSHNLAAGGLFGVLNLVGRSYWASIGGAASVSF
jgi:hypothetical protein